MPKKPTSLKLHLAENAALHARLEKAEATLSEILSGESDALFVTGMDGAQLFSLEGADQAYRLLVENMSEGALTLSADGLVLYANQRFAEMLGTPLEKVIGSEIYLRFAHESRPLLQTLLQKDALDKHREELMLVTADGRQIPVYLSVSRLLVEETDSVCMIVTDLTEQKHNEAILATEKLSNAILEQAADAIVICDQNGRIMRASKQAQALYGKSPLGQQFEQAFPLCWLDDTAFSTIGAIDTNQSRSSEARLTYKKREYDLMVSVGHLKDTQYELLGSVVTLTDITERKKTDAEIKLKHTMLVTQQETSLDAILVVDENGDINSYNQQFIDMWQVSPQIVNAGLDAPVLEAVTDQVENPGAFVARVKYLYEHREEKSHEEIQLKDGRIIDRYSSPVTGADNVYYGRVWYFRDITERKKTEASIKYLNRVLSVLSGINTLIVRVKDREELFREACNIAVEKGGFRMAMIVIVDPVTKLSVSVTSAGKDEKLLAAIKDVMSSADGMKTTLVAQAISEKINVIANNTQNDTRLLFGKQYAEAGVKSMTVLPLIISGEAVGILALYASEDEFFQKDEMKLLTELAGDIAFAIDHIDKQDRLSYLAYYDELTGLANRRLFLDRMTQYIHSAINGQYKLALGMINLERFKNINDSLGRSAGDSLLKQVAKWLTQFAQDANLLARIDADHFAFVVPEIKTDRNLVRLIEKLMAAFQEHSFDLNDATFRIGIKIGIAVFPDDGDNVDTLYTNAEAALKKTRLSGDRYLFYTQKMTEAVADKLSLENQLRRAIDNEEFVLYYQPKVNLVSGKIASAEALIRWNDPVSGLVPPGKFIPLLEETGLIFEVGRWALHKAIEDNMHWRAAGLATVRIAVNVSPLQLRNINFIDEIRQVIALDVHAAEGLELEITESLIMDNVEQNIARLQAIRAMGITIAIDDFGTGFSSLNYLSKLPVDTLKIDRSFVVEMDKSEGLALVTTIIVMAHGLNLKVVAEGVETEHQMRQLLSLNCDEMQGFLFSKPVPAEIFEAKFLVPLISDTINEERH